MDCDKRQLRASYRWLEKHKRLHAQHGPIDLIVQVEGIHSECILAFEQAINFFDSVLTGLVRELDLLRLPIEAVASTRLRSVVACHMQQSVAPYQNEFITPMAAVAGAVADCTLAALCRDRTLARASVNNGGDIAFHLSPNKCYTVGVCESTLSSDHAARVVIDHIKPIRGIATSGWQGRSYSLGIADAVTVLARNAASADTAATLIANRIDLPNSGKVLRTPACELSPDSDLGSRAVTVDVQCLTSKEKQQALINGQQYAQTLLAHGLIDGAYMALQGQRVVVGHNPNIQWKQSA